MLKRRKIFISVLIILALTNTSVAQQPVITYSVLVIDSMQQGVPSASVSIETADKTGISFSFTDEKGQATLELPEKDFQSTLQIKVTSLGYNTCYTALLPNKVTYVIGLKSNSNILTEVKIKTRKRPRVVLLGDTLQYVVKDFSSAYDRTIGDVLKKLPGIEVSSNGTIEFKGKAIGHFYIDGDDLLNDKYNIASNNIQVEMVDTIQVIDNNQPIKVLQGIQTGEKPAINITLKKDARMHWIHDINAGIGLAAQYEAAAVSMAFKPNFKSINTLKSNNTGISALSEVSSLYNNGFDEWDEKNEPGDFLSTSLFSPPNIDKRRWLFNKSLMGSENNLWKGKNNLTLKVNGDFVHESQRSNYSSSFTNFSPLDTITYIETGKDKLNNNLYDLKLTLNTNRTKSFLDNTFNVSYNDINTISNLLTNNNSIDQRLFQKRFKLSNSFSSILLIKKKIISQVKSFISYNNNPENLNIMPGVQESLLNNGIKYFSTNQAIAYNNFFSKNSFGIKLINGEIYQAYTVGFTYDQQVLNADLAGTKENQEEIIPGSNFSDKGHYTNYKPFVLSEWNWSNEKQEISSSLYIKVPFITYNDNLKSEILTKKSVLFNPSLHYQLKLAKENKVVVNAYVRNDIGNIQDVYTGTLLTDYRTVVSKDLPLQKINNKGISARLNLQKSIKVLFAHVGVSYSVQNYNYISSYLIDQNITRQVALPFKNSLETFTFNSGISKYLFALKTNVGVKFRGGISKTSRLQNDRLLPVINYSNTYEINP